MLSTYRSGNASKAEFGTENGIKVTQNGLSLFFVKTIYLCKFVDNPSSCSKRYHFKNESIYDLEEKVKVTKTKLVMNPLLIVI